MLSKQIVQLLRAQVIPWTVPGARSGIIVARQKMRAADMPEDVTVSYRKIAGQRMAMKNKREHGNQRYFIAKWSQANLQEIALPKIACIISGAADYLLGNGCVHCGPGNFILMPPGIPHQNKGPFLQGARLRNGSCVLLHAVAHQHGVLFWYSRSLNEKHINEMADNYLIPNVTAVQLLNLLMDEAAAERPYFDSMAGGFLAAFFAIIACEIEAGNYVTPGPKEQEPEPARSAASFAEQVQAYIEANCHRPLKVEDVAMHMYMSCSQFSRRMRQETGVTFIELLTRVRIERACKMLRETECTFAIITAYLSFHSYAHFQTLFRSRVGCTPMEYRRQSRNNLHSPKN
jgi:AraC-like DNA-binding protein